MGQYKIQGGTKLTGELTIQGAKNSALPILAASILNGTISIIHNCPKISDVFFTLEIIKSLGAKVKIDGNTVIIDSSTINNTIVANEMVSRMRSSFLFMGSLLGRFKKASLGTPGGCLIGGRPIDIHLSSLERLGATITTKGNAFKCNANELVGKELVLDFPSVGATQNIMLAAILAKGTTTIKGAAKEPEIIDLQNFLCSMGAKVFGAGSSIITIEGVQKLNATSYKIMPDRIVTGTYLCAAAITNGNIKLNNIDIPSVQPILNEFEKLNAKIRLEKDSIIFSVPSTDWGLNKLVTNIHPGFPTDMQAQFTSMLAMGQGSTIIEETIFEKRIGHISQLKEMGANITIYDNDKKFIVKGVEELQGAIVKATDLRCGAALILAGLGARGETTVYGSEFVERGYENIELDLTKLGANIKYGF